MMPYTLVHARHANATHFLTYEYYPILPAIVHAYTYICREMCISLSLSLSLSLCVCVSLSPARALSLSHTLINERFVIHKKVRAECFVIRT